MRCSRSLEAPRAQRAALAALASAALALTACGSRPGAPVVFGSSLSARPGKGDSKLDSVALAEEAAAFETAFRAAVRAGSAGVGVSGAAVPADVALFLRSYEELAALTERAIDPMEAARGAALDRAVAEARRLGAEDFLLELGGTVYAAGAKARGGSWRVVIGTASRSQGASVAGICSIPLRDRALAVARAEDDRPVRPAQGIREVAVAAPSALAAEAMAEAFLELGPTSWLMLVSGIPGFDAVFITEDDYILATAGLYRILSLEADGYEVLRI